MASELVDRIPPQNLDAEQSVLGAMLLDRDAIHKAMELLEEKSFYRDAHRLIFSAIVALTERGEAVDIVTVGDELQRRQQLEAVGGRAYLAELAQLVPTTANVEYYARIVLEKALLRSLIQVASEITQRAFAAAEDVDTILDFAERKIFQLTRERKTRPYARLKDVLVDTFEHIQRMFETRGDVIGVPTGFPALDRLMAGLHPSELIVLAARPSQGKTALALNIAAHAAVRARIPVVIFSLEMAREQLAQRLLSAEAKVSGFKLRTGNLAPEDWQRLSVALGHLGDAPLFIDDTPNMSILEMRAKSRRLKADHDIGLIVVDYLQLMHAPGKAENRQQEISEISRSLKALARELHVPILALSQLSRAVEQREGRRPQLSDLRESGAIEQDADAVLFIYRDPKLEEERREAAVAGGQSRTLVTPVELILAKQRNGPVGSVELVYFHDWTLFGSVDKTYAEEPS
ncbi:MAG: replicative DNA helicase [Clostridiales bacterium]|nr:replicative DNA helicase [Clostridiales bacterium]